MKFREREKGFRFAANWANSRLKATKEDLRAVVKTLVNRSGKNESTRADCPYRPSGWFQRRGSKTAQKTSRTPEQIFGQAAVGLTFRGFSDSELSKTKA